jgi:hypothetical protein
MRKNENENELIFPMRGMINLLGVGLQDCKQNSCKETKIEKYKTSHTTNMNRWGQW